MREKKDIRLFFALWPDDKLRAYLDSTARALSLDEGARRVPASNLHVTLHFIGNVFFEEMACLQKQARRVRFDRFSFEIDCPGSFRKPRVAWLGCHNAPDELFELQLRLGRELQDCGFEPEKRPYHPHVTVARKIGSPPGDGHFEPIRWDVNGFSLIEVQQRETGVQYRVVETYPLS